EPEHAERPVTLAALTPEPTPVPEATAMAETIVVVPPPPVPSPPVPTPAPPPPTRVAGAPTAAEVSPTGPVEPPDERPRRRVPVLPLSVGAVVVIAALALLV